MEEKEETSFTVNDRRAFSSQEGGPAAEKEHPSGRQGAPGEKQPRAEGQTGPLPEVDFASFIVSLATAAQVNLGNVPNPETGLTAANLAAAKQFIDIVGMLRDKTKGNLSEQEQELVENILSTLRMQYVKTLEGNK
jgi:hypothetical protein